MAGNDLNDIGKEIRDAVQNAVTSMDFAQLNHQITDSVNEALKEIQGAFGNQGGAYDSGKQREAAAQREARQRQRAREAVEAARRAAKAAQAKNAADQTTADDAAETAREAMETAREALRTVRDEFRSARRTAMDSEAARRTAQAARGEAEPRTAGTGVIARNPKGSVSGVLYTVFGSICLGIAAVVGVIFGGLTAAMQVGLGAFLFMLCFAVAPLGIGGIWMLLKGAGNRGRVERFRSYVQCIKDKKYIKISELAAAVKKSERYVRRDLKKMIELDMFPQGHINEEQTMFILDHATYAEYEAMRQETERKARQLQSETPAQQQLRETVERGQAYLQAIRQANDDIPGEEVSNQLYRLEAAVSRIYVQIQKSPEKLPELRKFQEYYLPTALKLVETYREFDKQPFAGENITTAKKEIEASLDTINGAFEKLFDGLFAETAMDVSTDISVLQTLLAQEGLTEEVWKNATEEKAEYLDMTDMAMMMGAGPKPEN